MTDLRSEVRAAIDDPDSPATDALLARLRQSGGRGLSELQADPDRQVRGWLAFVAAQTLDTVSAIEMLAVLLRDRDGEVSSAALQELVRLSPEAAQTHADVIRKRLRSRDLEIPVQAMWQLTRLRDEGSLPALRAVASHPAFEHHRWIADIAQLIITGNEDKVIQALRAHDHRRTRFLALAASIIGSASAIEALNTCATGAPDEECQQWCRWFLDRMPPAPISRS